MEESLERLGLVELAQDAQPLLSGQFDLRRLDPLLDPGLLRRLLDVHVLDPGGAAVGVAQMAQRITELHHLEAGETAGGELPIEVPDGEAVAERVELGVHHGRLLAERVEVGDQMAPHPVHIEDLEYPALLLRPLRAAHFGVVVDRPPRRGVGDLHRPEDLVVEPLLAEQQRLHPPEEVTRLGALDHPVVVGAGEGDDATDSLTGQEALVGAEVLRRVGDGADADDHTLVGHETGHRLRGPDHPRVGQRGGGPGEVVGGDPVLPRPGGSAPRRRARTPGSPSRRRA